ncbi:MAG TPA: DUF2442 domain-containing protein [Alphaproteobacteria bacterium]|jgi:hypothetical protein
MHSGTLGAASSSAEVVGLSKHGFWLLLGEGEVFVPFSKFPWFKSAPVSRVLNVRRLSADHLRWPDLDVDLHVDSLREPEKFPLVAKSKAAGVSEPKSRYGARKDRTIPSRRAR